MGIIVEKVNENDTEALLKIYAPYVQNTAITFEYDVPSVDEFRNRIKSISSKYPYIKAIENGEIVGYAYATTFKSRPAYDWAVETTIYVRKEKRGKGIGKILYATLEKSLINMGILNLNACIASPITKSKYLSLASVKFHVSMGYKKVALFHKSGFKFNRWFNSTWMEKIVGDHVSNQPPVQFGKWNI